MRISNLYTSRQKTASAGFTIVELLVVIVVIGILAAITIVSYSGIQQNAATTVLKSDLRNGANQLSIIQIETGSYPANGDSLQHSPETVIDYVAVGSGYCLAVSSDAAPTGFYIDSTSGTIAEGDCSGSTPAPSAPVITTTTLPDAVVATPYSATIQVSGSGVTYSVTTGSLPSGLLLNSSTGVISGTPTQASSSVSSPSTFTITAQNSNGSGARALTIYVDPGHNQGGGN